MKGFLVFFMVALVGVSAIPQQKGVIEDALALKECIEAAIGDMQNDVNNVIASVGAINDVIGANLVKLRQCNALGGPSISEQIEVAKCVISLAADFRDEINAVVSGVEQSIQDLINSGNKIEACF